MKFWRSTTVSPGKRPSLSHPIQGHDRPTAIKIVPRSINVRDILASLTPDEGLSHIDIPHHNGQGSARCLMPSHTNRIYTTKVRKPEPP